MSRAAKNDDEYKRLELKCRLNWLFDSKKIAKRIKQYRFNHWNTIPAYVEDMADSKDVLGMNLSHLKSITTGGDFLTSVVKSKADAVIKNGHSDVKVGQGYGASEILGSFGYTYEVGATQGSIGKPLVGNQFKIILEIIQIWKNFGLPAHLKAIITRFLD